MNCLIPLKWINKAQSAVIVVITGDGRTHQSIILCYRLSLMFQVRYAAPAVLADQATDILFGWY